MHDIIKTYIPRQKTFTFVVRKVLAILEDQLEKSENTELETYPFEDLYSCPELKKLRFLVHRKVF